MLQDKNIHRFESELKIINRPGRWTSDGFALRSLLDYIRKSDFYSATCRRQCHRPSTRYHLSLRKRRPAALRCGLLQHSLNVLDALRGMMLWNITEHKWSYSCANKFLTYIPDESVTITALLHDLCKTHYYKTSTRNVKNEQKDKGATKENRPPVGAGGAAGNE